MFREWPLVLIMKAKRPHLGSLCRQIIYVALANLPEFQQSETSSTVYARYYYC